MPYLDPDKCKQVKRESARRRRAGSESPGDTLPLPEGIQFDTAQGWLEALDLVTRQVLSEQCDALARARTIAHLTSVGLRVLELVNVDDRITKLEDLLEQKENGANGYRPTIQNT
jgi:hypothetical protein